MQRNVHTISVNLNAGTAKFFADLDAAKGKIKEFGRAGVSEAKATTAAMKALEGNFFNNTRAADKFLESVLGLGPALQIAFPLIGGIAFAGMIGEVGNKVYEFFKRIKEAPERVEMAFRGLSEPLRLTNDELAVTNDRLANEISKLEGRHQNTLKLALDEARVAADRLADSLEKDLAGLNKILKEENIGFWKGLFTGQASSSNLLKEFGGESGLEGFPGRIAEITDEGNDHIRAATTLKARDGAQTELNTKLLKAYREELAAVDKGIAKLASDEKFQAEGEYTGGDIDYSGTLALARKARRQLLGEMAGIERHADNTSLTGRKEQLQTDRENAKQDEPFKNRMKSLGAEIDAIKAKLDAVGKPEAIQILAKAFGDAQKAIEQTGKEMEGLNKHLTKSQEGQIRAAELTLASTEAEATWRTKLAGTTASIDDRVRSQELLTAAIGKSYEATRLAYVESRLMQELGQHFGDSAWMKDHHGDVTRLRTGHTREFDAQHGDQAAQATEKLREEIQLERELAGAQQDGAEAVRQAALAVKLRQLALLGATKEQLAAEIELFNAQRANANAGDIAKIDVRIQATQRMTAAILGGAEAERQAGLENKYAELRRGGDVVAPGVIGVGQKEMAERSADAVDYQFKITAEALKTGMAYQDHLQIIAQEVAELEKIRAAQGDNLAIEISLRNLENDRLRTLVQESLQLRGVRDGVRAFFIEMQQDAKSAAVVIYDALNSAMDRTAANLAKVLTGQKTEWAKTFKDIGDQMLQASLKSAMQKGLGELGKKFGIDLGGNKPDGTANNPFWVRLAAAGGVLGVPGSPGVPGAPSAPGASPPVFGGASPGGFIFHLLSRNKSVPGIDLAKMPSAAGPDDGFAPGRPTGGLDGSSPSLAFWVRIAQGPTPQPSPGKQIAGGLLGALGGLFSSSSGGGGGGGGGTPDVSSSISFPQVDYGGGMALGGGVDPGHIYRVGGRGEEWFVPPSRGDIVPNYAIGDRAGVTITNHIDARGADLGVQNRIARAIEASNRASVAMAVKASHERSRRVPGK